MNRNFLSYMGSMILIFALVAIIPSDLSMIIAAAAFSVAAISMPFWMTALLATIGALAFALITSDPWTGVFMALSFLVPGWIQGMMLRNRRSLSWIITSGAVARGGLLLVCYSRMASVENATFKDFLIGDFPKEAFSKMVELGYPSETEALALQMWEFTGEMIPSIICISALGFAFLSLACTRFMTRKIPGLFLGMRKFSEIKVDWTFTVCAILVFALSFIQSSFQLLLFNCLYVFYVIYYATGFAFAYRIINRGIKIPVVSFILTIIVGIISCGVLLPVLGVIGSFMKTDYDKKLSAIGELEIIQEEIINEEKEDDESRKDE